jgi:16S rRNA processing protein RimM
VEPEFPPDAVEVGRIAGAWGVKGWLRVEPYSAEPEALFGTKRWFLRPPEPQPPGPPRVWPELLRVVQAREHGDAVVAQVQDVCDRDSAQALRGARVFVSRASFPTPADGEFYWVDLIGLAVVNRQGETLGTVEGLMETGAHDVLRVRRPEPAAVPGELLIPFVDAYVDRVDLASRVVTVDWGADY